MGTGSPPLNADLVLPLVLDRRAERDPDGILVQQTDGATCTNASFSERARRWANALASVGVQQDDLVATMLPTSLESYLCWISLGWLRAPEVPLNTDLRGNLLIHVMNDSQARVVVADSRFLDRLVAVADDLRSVEVVLVIDAPADLPATNWRWVRADELLDASPPAVLRRPEHHDTHAVVYTSGTTGPSKGVLQPWAAIQSMPAGIFPNEEPGATEDGGIFTAWPTFHTSGRFGLSIAAHFDWRMVLREKFSVSSFWSDVERFRVTHATLLVVAPLLLRQPPTADDRHTVLQRVAMYPLIPRFGEFANRFGVRISTGYGLSEAGFAIVADQPVNHRTVGRPAPGWQAAIVDELDDPVGPDTLGEIVLRSDFPWRISKGYLRRPDATAASWRNGWFHTGDVGTYDADGNFYFVDRMTDSLRHRGHNVSSLEVEAEVLAHPAVTGCACVGVPSDLADEQDFVKDDDIKVFVSRSSDDLTELELLEFLVERMPRFMLPRYIEFRDELPRTATNKVRKVDLPKTPTGWDWQREGIQLAP